MQTERLFHHDAYLRDFTARVVRLVENQGRRGVELDRTAFYATAGGQPHDTGRLAGLAVVDVTDEDGAIIHWLDGPAAAATVDAQAQPAFAEGEEVRGEVDWPRRFDHMQQHDGQHILSGAFWNLLKAETVSFHLGADAVTIDLDLPDLTAAQAAAVTDLANQIIFEDRPIFVHVVETADEASRFPLRKPPKVLTGVRIVEVQGFDYSACGGTHPRRTGEVGPIAIRRWERYKNGTRVEFLCGGRAVRDYQSQNGVGWELTRLLSVSLSELPQAVGRLQEQVTDLRRNWEKAHAIQLEAEAEGLWQAAPALAGGARLVTANLGDRPVDDMKSLAFGLAGHPRTVALLGSVAGDRGQLLFQRSADLAVDLNQVLKGVLPHVEGRGGGQPGSAQGGGPRREGLDPALAEAAGRVQSMLAES
ncbi:MAG: alanyl-tRNA editing protein [Symbiobacteriia bacterium]